MSLRDFSLWDGQPAMRADLAACGDHVAIGANVVITNPEKVRIGDHVRIDPGCYISGAVTIGDYVQICAGVVLGGAGGGITLGNWTFVGFGSKLFTGSEDYRYLVNAHWGASHVDARPIVFHDYAGVASDVMVMPGVTLKTGMRIGARTFVYRSPEDPWTVYAGNPLRLLKPVDQLETVAESMRLEG